MHGGTADNDSELFLQGQLGEWKMYIYNVGAKTVSFALSFLSGVSTLVTIEISNGSPSNGSPSMFSKTLETYGAKCGQTKQ